MERLHTSAPALVLLICLHAFFGCCKAFPQFQGGSNDTTLVVGETLTLTCNFSEPVDGNKFVFWKKGKPVIGSCPGRLACFKVGEESTNDSRITFDSREGRWFQLNISNVTILDAGSYECELYYSDDNNNKHHHTIDTMGVLVLPLQVVSEGASESTTKTSSLTSEPFTTISQPAIKSSLEGSMLTTESSTKKLSLPTKSSPSKMSPLTTEERKPTPQFTQSIIVRTSNSNILSDQTDSKQGQFSLNIH